MWVQRPCCHLLNLLLIACSGVWFKFSVLRLLSFFGSRSTNLVTNQSKYLVFVDLNTDLQHSNRWAVETSSSLPCRTDLWQVAMLQFSVQASYDDWSRNNLNLDYDVLYSNLVYHYLLLRFMISVKSLFMWPWVPRMLSSKHIDQ